MVTRYSVDSLDIEYVLPNGQVLLIYGDELHNRELLLLENHFSLLRGPSTGPDVVIEGEGGVGFEEEKKGSPTSSVRSVRSASSMSYKSSGKSAPNIEDVNANIVHIKLVAKTNEHDEHRIIDIPVLMDGHRIYDIYSSQDPDVLRRTVQLYGESDPRILTPEFMEEYKAACANLLTSVEPYQERYHALMGLASEVEGVLENDGNKTTKIDRRIKNYHELIQEHLSYIVSFEENSNLDNLENLYKSSINFNGCCKVLADETKLRVSIGQQESVIRDAVNKIVGEIGGSDESKEDKKNRKTRNKTIRQSFQRTLSDISESELDLEIDMDIISAVYESRGDQRAAGERIKFTLGAITHSEVASVEAMMSASFVEKVGQIIGQNNVEEVKAMVVDMSSTRDNCDRCTAFLDNLAKSQKLSESIIGYGVPTMFRVSYNHPDVRRENQNLDSERLIISSPDMNKDTTFITKRSVDFNIQEMTEDRLSELIEKYTHFVSLPMDLNRTGIANEKLVGRDGPESAGSWREYCQSRDDKGSNCIIQ